LWSTTGNSSKQAILTITPVRLVLHTGAYHLGGGTGADQEGADWVEPTDQSLVCLPHPLAGAARVLNTLRRPAILFGSAIVKPGTVEPFSPDQNSLQMPLFSLFPLIETRRPPGCGMTFA